VARGKSIKKLLLDASQAAVFAGIEIHNKPNIAYRYPTATILIVNAWELVLKAYIYQYIGKKKIYEKDGKHTISFSKALVLVRDHINFVENNNNFMAVSENIFQLNEYRCSNIHFAEGELDPVIFMLLSKAVINYDNFVKKYFKKDITKEDNLIILPIGLKLPFNPIDYLKQDYKDVKNDFVNAVIKSIRELNRAGVEDSIVVGFNLVTDRVKNIKNADIVAALCNEQNAVPLKRAIRYTDDPNAPVMRVEPDLPPLRYAELRQKVKEKKPDIKFGKTFNAVMKKIQANKKYCRSNYLDPKNKSGTKKDFYFVDAIDAVIIEYERMEADL
jgi:Protein of unknown function (DUF3644).